MTHVLGQQEIGGSREKWHRGKLVAIRFLFTCSDTFLWSQHTASQTDRWQYDASSRSYCVLQYDRLKIISLFYGTHMIRGITTCSPVLGWIKSLQLRFFGHLAGTAPKEDHHHVIAAALRPPADWRRPRVGRPRTTWLRTIDDDFQSLNFGVHTAWRKAKDRDVWHQVISMAMLHHEVHQ